MNTAKIRFIGQRAGGMDRLKGLKIAHVYQDEAMAGKPFPSSTPRPPSTALRCSTWPCNRRGSTRRRPGCGSRWPSPTGSSCVPKASCTWTALKEAAQVGFPRDKIVGGADLRGAGSGAGRGGGHGLHLRDLPWHRDGLPADPGDSHYVYARGQGPGPEGDIGTDRWKRGVVDAMVATEGIRRAMRDFGNKPLTGAQVQWGLEHLTLTAASLKALGVEGLFPPITPLVPRS